jgi:hypothetical protein
MKEFHKNGCPVWRKRTAEHRADGHAKHVGLLVKNLNDLERETRPSGGARTAIGKDLAAFQALEFAGELVDALAGWALDHQVGLALSRLNFLPLGTQSVRKLPEYTVAKSQVDSHHHEREGGAVFSGVATDRLGLAERRTALKNLLYANPGGFERLLVYELHEGLDSLEWGRPTPIVQAVKSKSHAALREIRLRLRAICFVEYERGKGVKKFKAQDQAAEAFGVDSETIRTWEKRLREELSYLEVFRQLSFAHNAGTLYRADPQTWISHEQAYGLSMLKHVANEYKNAVQQRLSKKRTKPKGRRR